MKVVIGTVVIVIGCVIGTFYSCCARQMFDQMAACELGHFLFLFFFSLVHLHLAAQQLVA